MWYATISKAYKAGSYSGVGILSGVAGEDRSGDYLQPIAPGRVVSDETGMRIEAFGGRLRFNPTAFYMQWSNRQAARQLQCSGEPNCPVPPGFRVEVSNTGDIDLFGVELDAQAYLTEEFWFDGSFGYTSYDLKDESANGGPNLYPEPPEFSYNIGANYSADIGPGELTLNASYAYTSDQAAHPTETGDSAYRLPAIELVNARIRFQPHNAPVTLSLFANNLFDNTYATYATRFGGGYWDRGGLTRIQIDLFKPERSAPPFDLTGTWFIDLSEGFAHFMFGPPYPQFGPEGIDALIEAPKAQARNESYRDAIGQCYPPGMPMIMTRVWPHAFIQLPTASYMISGFNNSVRTIFLDGREFSDPDFVVPG